MSLLEEEGCDVVLLGVFCGSEELSRRCIPLLTGGFVTRSYSHLCGWCLAGSHGLHRCKKYVLTKTLMHDEKQWLKRKPVHATHLYLVSFLPLCSDFATFELPKRERKTNWRGIPAILPYCNLTIDIKLLTLSPGGAVPVMFCPPDDEATENDAEEETDDDELVVVVLVDADVAAVAGAETDGVGGMANVLEEVVVDDVAAVAGSGVLTEVVSGTRNMLETPAGLTPCAFNMKPSCQ